MIDAGMIVMLLGALTLALGPAERAVATRRWVRTEILDPALRVAFPPPPPARDLDRLVAAADARLESQQLTRQRRRWQRRHP